METLGYVTPASETEAHEIYERLGPPAQEVTREVAMAMDFDPDEYERRVTSAVVSTARDVLFSTLLTVQRGRREAFDAWLEEPPQRAYDVHVEGSEHVDHVAWHAAPSAEAVVATTYQDQPEAAVATLRRIAWGRLYRPLFHDDQEA